MSASAKAPPMVQVEVTDTFGGEPNYSWVKRFSFELRPSMSDLAIVRKAKALADWSGVPCDREGGPFDDNIALRPRDGQCVVMFITIPTE